MESRIGSGVWIVTQILKKMVIPNPKFRIVSRNNKFVPQEFLGIWKLGLYTDIAKEFNHSNYLRYQFEHENISEAELVIDRRKKQFNHKKYVVRNYYEV